MQNIPNRISFKEVLFGVMRLIPRIPQMLSSLFRLLAAATDKSQNWNDYFGKVVHRYPDRIALKGDEGEYTFAEVDRRSDAIAGYLQEQEYTYQDTFALFMENSFAYVIILMALSKLGIPVLLLNRKMKESDISELLQQAQCRVLISDCILGLNEDSEIGTLYWNVPAVQDSSLRLDEIIDNKDCSFRSVHTVMSNDVFVYLTTSGTSGSGYKIAPISHKRVIMGAIWFGEIIQKTKPHDTFYAPLPMHHATSLFLAWNSAWIGGASLVIQKRMNLKNIIPESIKWQVTALVYVGDLLTLLTKQPQTELDTSHSIQKILGNGLRPSLWNECKERFGFTQVCEMYGASENPRIFSNILNLDCTVGMSFSSFAIVAYDEESGQIVKDAQGKAKPVATGESGLLLYKISSKEEQSFYLQETESLSKIKKGLLSPNDIWFYTGDLVQRLGYQHIRFVDRVGDTYRWRGENCSTSRIEEMLLSETTISNVLVFGIQLKHYDGRAGMAVIECTENLQETLLRRVEELFVSQLQPEVIPRFIRFTNHIVQTDSFKNRKSIYKNEGIQKSENLFVWEIETGSYQVIDDIIFDEIAIGTYRL